MGQQALRHQKLEAQRSRRLDRRRRQPSNYSQIKAMTDDLRATAEQRLQRLRYLAATLEHGHPTASELIEVAQVLRQLIEEVEK
jgi:hypothetical protein